MLHSLNLVADLLLKQAQPTLIRVGNIDVRARMFIVRLYGNFLVGHIEASHNADDICRNVCCAGIRQYTRDRM